MVKERSVALTNHELARALVHERRLKLKWDERLDRAPPPLPLGSIDLVDKVEGMMLGLAIGDALGNTTESISPADRLGRCGWIDGYLPNAYAAGRCVGLPSDDTQLAFRTLQHLADAGTLDPDALARTLISEPIFGIGRATSEWAARFRWGAPWHLSGPPAAGNGALMRIAPVLIPHLLEPGPGLWGDTLLAAHLTHDDELSNLSCVAMVDALWRALGTTGIRPEGGWIGPWLEVCDGLCTGKTYQARGKHPPGFDGTIGDLVRGYVMPVLEQSLEVDAAGEIWHSGAYLLETVPSVLYVLERHGHDPREAILQAVNHTRDNDTHAAIVGAAVGALHGARALPQAWVDGLTGRLGADDDDRLFDLLARACARFGIGSSATVRQRAARFAARQRP